MASDPFAVLADPVRRRILELLAEAERPAGDLVRLIGDEYGIGQPAVSMQLRTLREAGCCRVRAVGATRWYCLDPTGLHRVARWLAGVVGEPNDQSRIW